MSSFSDQELRGQMEELRAKISATEVVLRYYSSPASEGERLAQLQLREPQLGLFLDLGKDRLQQLFIDLQQQLSEKEKQLTCEWQFVSYALYLSDVLQCC